MEKFKRYVIFIIGLFINSFGVSLITRADLGTSPISSIPYVLSLNFPFTLGEFTIFLSIFLIILQLIILGKNFKAEHVLQIPVSIAFGYFIDFCMMLLKNLNADTYLLQAVYLIAGCIVLGIGVYMEMLANVVMLPGESFVRAVVFRWKKDFGITKIIFDVAMALMAAALSMLFAGRVEGVREGTVAAALLVGFIARVIDRKFSFIRKKVYGKESTDMAETGENEGVCILIGRQYGSGGHDIGKEIAEKLGFAFYDKEIIQMVAGTTGYEPEYISRNEEIMSSNRLYDLLNQVYAFPDDNSPRDNIFKAEAEVIKKIAAKGNCVIVGRCADYILLDRENCISVFLFAPTEYRVHRIMETEGLNEEAARKKVKQIDKQRADHYRYYTNQIWGMAANYHICIDTSLGMDAIKNILKEVAYKKIKHMEKKRKF